MHRVIIATVAGGKQASRFIKKTLNDEEEALDITSTLGNANDAVEKASYLTVKQQSTLK